MSAALIIGYGIYIAAALMIALGLALSLGLTLGMTNRYARYMLPLVLPVIGLAVATSTILSNRSLRYIDASPTGINVGVQYIADAGPADATWILRLFTVVIVALCGALIVSYLYRRERQPADGQGLLLALLVFFLTNTVTNAIFGTRPEFVHNHFYPPVILAAAFATRADAPEIVVRFAKITLFVFLVGSVGFLLVKRHLVLQSPYVYGLIPALRVRLWGLASHANSLGPLALMYLLLEAYYPIKHRLGRSAAIVLAVSVLVLAQSKTAWVIGLVVAGVVWYYRTATEMKAAWQSGRVSYQLAGIAVVTIGVALSLFVAILATDVGDVWRRFLGSSMGDQVLSLTGRDAVWEVALDTWRGNPLFGYGPRIWDPEFRKAIGMAFAYSAHSQFLQSLAGAGSLGVAGLIVYLAALLTYGVRLARTTQGLSIALVIFLVLRCTTETPLSTNTVYNGDFLVHLLVFSLLMRYAAAMNSRDRAVAGPNSKPPSAIESQRLSDAGSM